MDKMTYRKEKINNRLTWEITSRECSPDNAHVEVALVDREMWGTRDAAANCCNTPEDIERTILNITHYLYEDMVGEIGHLEDVREELCGHFLRR